MKSFSEFLLEASLSGNSRSAQKSNWDAYVVDDPDWADKEYEIERDDVVYDENLEDEIAEVTKGDMIKLLSLDLMKRGSSFYAQISTSSDDEGYLKISSIKKPRGSTNNTKDLTPKKLGITGKKYDINGLITATIAGIDGISSITPTVKAHLLDCINSIANKNLFEDKIIRFTKNIALSQSHNLSESDLKVISKNFGEVLSALFILKSNKKAKFVEFPEAENEGLYDFIRYEDSGQKIFYSVKASTGSVTALKNLNKFIQFLSNEYNKDDINKLKMLITDKDNKTIDIIIDYINEFEPNIAAFINDQLDIKTNKLNHADLSNWWLLNAKKMTEDEIYRVFSKIYAEINYPLNTNTVKTLMSIFSAQKDTSKNGYIIYPLGSYIVKSLNADPIMLKLLNDVLTASYISNSVLQATVNVSNKDIEVKLIKFKNNSFKYDYNAMMKAPGNRPLGLKEI